jgi:hypothetical protein
MAALLDEDDVTLESLPLDLDEIEWLSEATDAPDPDGAIIASSPPPPPPPASVEPPAPAGHTVFAGNELIEENLKSFDEKKAVECWTVLSRQFCHEAIPSKIVLRLMFSRKEPQDETLTLNQVLPTKSTRCLKGNLL